MRFGRETFVLLLCFTYFVYAEIELHKDNTKTTRTTTTRTPKTTTTRTTTTRTPKTTTTRTTTTRTPKTTTTRTTTTRAPRTTTTRAPITVTTTTRAPITTTTTRVLTKTTTTTKANFSLYETQALVQTNYYRKIHCAPLLKFEHEIRVIAQKYADHLCSTKSFVHSGNTYRGQALGENLYAVSSSRPINLNTRNGSSPIAAWYSEVRYYNYSSPAYSASTGHFTQTVWVNSQLFGLGYCCTSDSLKCYVVANYFPAGNYRGQFATNVLRDTCG